MRALSVRVNDVVGVAGYVLPGTRVDVVATVNPTQQQPDVTSKIVLTNVLVLTAGTKIEQDTEDGKPIQVSVVTLLRRSERSGTPDAGEHRRKDSTGAAQPARQDGARDDRHQAGRADGIGRRTVRAAAAASRCAARRADGRRRRTRAASDRRDHSRR